MTSEYPNTRSQSRLEADTDEEMEYASANESEVEQDETVIHVPPDTGSPAVNTLANVMLQMKLDQAKRDCENERKEQEYRAKEQEYKIE